MVKFYNTYNGNAWIDPAIAHIVLQEASLYPPSVTAESETNQFASKSEFNNIESSDLTEKESEVLQLIVEGYSNVIIAERLCITVSAVKIHVRSILKKLCPTDK